MSKSIFRKSSLEQMASPESLNEYIKITSNGLWSVLLGSSVLLIAIILWGFLGDIPNTLSTKGVIFPQNGVISAIPHSGGRINDMRVKVGDYVEAGQILAVIDQEEMIDDIATYKAGQTIDETVLDGMYSAYERAAIIYAPVSGTVLYARNTNETVGSNEPVARIVEQTAYADNQQVICYVEDATAKRLKEGMSVQVSPEFASREEYGYIYGRITDIGKYPVTEDDLLKALGSEQYIMDEWLENSCVEVRMTLSLDSEAKNKLKWSNPKGEDLPIAIGTYTDIQIVLKHYRPFELLF